MERSSSQESLVSREFETSGYRSSGSDECEPNYRGPFGPRVRRSSPLASTLECSVLGFDFNDTVATPSTHRDRWTGRVSIDSIVSVLSLSYNVLSSTDFPDTGHYRSLHASRSLYRSRIDRFDRVDIIVHRSVYRWPIDLEWQARLVEDCSRKRSCNLF